MLNAFHVVLHRGKLKTGVVRHYRTDFWSTAVIFIDRRGLAGLRGNLWLDLAPCITADQRETPMHLATCNALSFGSASVNSLFLSSHSRASLTRCMHLLLLFTCVLSSESHRNAFNPLHHVHALSISHRRLTATLSVHPSVLYIFFLFFFVSFLATVFWWWNKVIYIWIHVSVQIQISNWRIEILKTLEVCSYPMTRSTVQLIYSAWSRWGWGESASAW